MKKQIFENECALLVVEALYFFYYRKHINLTSLRAEVSLPPRGLNLHQLITLGNKYGLEMKAFSANFEELKTALILHVPVIALVKNELNFHYVVIEKLSNKIYLIYDPIEGKQKIHVSDFEVRYAGIFLQVRVPTDHISGSDFQVSRPNALWMQMYQRHARQFALVIGCIIFILAFNFASSLFLKIIFDSVIPGALTSTLFILSVSFGFIGLLRVITISARTFLTRYIAERIEAELRGLYLAKLTHGEVSLLRAHDDASHWQKIAAIPSLAVFIASAPLVVFSDSLMLIISGALLAITSPNLFALLVAAAGISVLLTIALRFALTNLQSGATSLNKSHITAIFDFINSRQDLKLPRGTFLRGYLDKSYLALKDNDYQQYKRVNLFRSINLLIELVSPIVITYFATKLVFNNELSGGSMLLFLSFSTFFIAPFSSITEILFSWQAQHRNYAMIHAFLLIKDEEPNSSGLAIERVKKIVFKNYSFEYDRPIFVIPSLEITSSTSIVGPNGVGKSTFLHVLRGMEFGRGQMLINGVDLPYYNLGTYRSKFLYISAGDHLPHGTIGQFLTQNNPELVTIFQNNFVRYNLQELFNNVGISTQAVVTDNGNNFSSGQRQVILLLQMFARDYDVIVLDEALENIDDSIYRFFSKYASSQKDIIFIEASHTGRFLTNGNEVKFENFAAH